jgi:hypothetical protein
MANDFSTDADCKALWKFESGALTADSKGTNTLSTGGTPAEDTGDFQEGAGCVDLEAGESDYLSIADANLNVGFPLKNGDATKKISVASWFKLESTPANCALWSKYNTTANSRSLGVNIPSGALNIINGYNDGANGEAIVPGYNFSAGIWYHLTVIVDGANSIWQVYVWDDTNQTSFVKNGELPHATNVENAAWVIGQLASLNAGYYFDGKIDELAVFSRLLNYLEVNAIREGTYNGPISLTGNDFSGDPHCMALYRFESGALAVDSKDSETLSEIGSPGPVADVVYFREGISSYKADGNSNFFRIDADLSSGFPFKLGTSNLKLSIAVWVRPTVIPGLGDYDNICAKWYAFSPYNYSFKLYLTNGLLYFGIGYSTGNNAEYTQICTLNQSNRFYHIGLALNGITGAWVARVWDELGEIANTYSGTLSNVPVRADAGSFAIAAEGVPSVWGNKFNGQIDELVVFNDLLTADEFDQIRQRIYTTPPGPTQAQFLRHGTWFGSGVKQRMWWAK